MMPAGRYGGRAYSFGDVATNRLHTIEVTALHFRISPIKPVLPLAWKCLIVDLYASLSNPIRCSLVELVSADQDEAGGPLEDLGDGGVPGVSGAGLDGDGEAFEACREGADVSLEASAPGAALDPGGDPSGDGFRGRGLDRGGRLLHSVGRGPELTIEGLIDEGAEPGAEVEVPLGAKALEALTGLGRDADMKWNRVQHKTHNNT